MARMVQCVKLGKEAEGLDRPTYPGELGKRIFENVSKEAWQAWVRHQTMLINENRLTPVDPKARKFLEGEMEKYFFGAGSPRPRVMCRPQNSCTPAVRAAFGRELALFDSCAERKARQGVKYAKNDEFALRSLRLCDDDAGS